MKHFQIETDKNIAYTKAGCSHCARAKELLKEYGISYTERDIVEYPEYMEELMSLMGEILEPGSMVTTPQIWFMGKYIGGEAELEKYLSTQAE
ncbi:MAG: glutaredoxin [Candidatus Moranbacteria bacterium]|nr:glutaredoxin [Candidatus Moranbacteria bacterium]